MNEFELIETGMTPEYIDSVNRDIEKRKEEVVRTRKAYQKAYRRQHKEAAIKAQKRYNKRNKKKLQIYQREYRHKHKQRIAAYQAAYRKRNNN